MTRASLRRTLMRERCFTRLFVLAVLGSTAGITPAAAGGDAGDADAAVSACAGPIAVRIQRHYETVRDLTARFEQRTETAALGGAASRALLGRGTVVFAKPGRMRWSYEEPEPSLVVSDGESVWIYDPEAGEAQHLQMVGDFLSGAAIQFLLGRGDLLKEFRVTAEDCGASPVLLRLQPRQDAPYEWLEVRADPATGRISETRVSDLLGNVTHVRFSEIRSNEDPDLRLFQFEPPEGVRVLELPAQAP